MVRFFAEPKDITDNVIKLSPEDAAHIRSLRLRPKEQFVVCNGDGTDYICRLGAQDNGSVADIIDKHQSLGEPSVECTIYIAYAKGDRLEYAVQKSVELGTFEIVLYESRRCVAVPRNISTKAERLQRIALETAKQCGRGIIPRVTSGGSLEAIITSAVNRSMLSIMCYESESQLHLSDVLNQHFPSLKKRATETRAHNAHDLYENELYKPNSVSIITGPEGGFESGEVTLAQSNGIHIVSLGHRVLRSETAPVAALTALMYHTGNM